jgi:murein L,D-transpeptidase YafK
LDGENPLREFHVVFGANPKGHKMQEGDERTPEGTYTLDYKKTDSAFYRAIHISYPNTKDAASAQSRGVKPGGQVMIHGQKNGLGWLSFISQHFNWTNGCVALSNEDMDIVWSQVKEGTPIEILP